jgi:hypothetical protein
MRVFMGEYFSCFVQVLFRMYISVVYISGYNWAHMYNFQNWLTRANRKGKG